jgi:predicted kinase
MSTKVYATMISTSETIARAGHAVIADAVFARPDERAAARSAASAAGVAFTGIWLTGDFRVLEARVAARRHDASDATVDVVRQQAQYDLGGLDWTQVDAGGTPEATLEAVRKVLI